MKRILTIICLLSLGMAFANPIAVDDRGKKKFKLNRRALYPAGFNIYGFGPTGKVAVTFDYFVTPKLSLELGAGLKDFGPNAIPDEHAFTIGGRYHFFGNTPLNITPYLGVFSGFEYTGTDVRNFNLYVPLGLQRIKKNGFTWSVEAAYQQNVYDPIRTFYGGGKIGFRF